MQSRLCAAPRSRAGGFTLVELLVVISIIAILASLALPALQGALTAAKKAQANTMLNQLKVALTSTLNSHLHNNGETVLSPSCFSVLPRSHLGLPPSIIFRCTPL